MSGWSVWSGWSYRRENTDQTAWSGRHVLCPEGGTGRTVPAAWFSCRQTGRRHVLDTCPEEPHPRWAAAALEAAGLAAAAAWCCAGGLLVQVLPRKLVVVLLTSSFTSSPSKTSREQEVELSARLRAFEATGE